MAGREERLQDTKEDYRDKEACRKTGRSSIYSLEKEGNSQKRRDSEEKSGSGKGQQGKTNEAERPQDRRNEEYIARLANISV